MIPQDTEPMPEVRPVNRPPAIDLVGIVPQPTQAVVTVNKQCLERNSFQVGAIDLDADQALVALWFLDAPLGSESFERPFHWDVNEPTEGQSSSLERIFDLDWSDPNNQPEAERLSIERPSTLTVLVVERDALNCRDELSGCSANLAEILRNCLYEHYPDDCVSSSPAIFRWTLDVQDQFCQ